MTDAAPTFHARSSTVYLLSAIVVGAALLLADDSAEAAYAQTVDIELGDFFIAPPEVPVAPDTELTLRVVNNGDIQHDITTEGEKGTERLATGDTAEVNLGIVTTGQPLWCSVPGHREQGMEATIVPGPPPDAGDRDPELGVLGTRRNQPGHRARDGRETDEQINEDPGRRLIARHDAHAGCVRR